MHGFAIPMPLSWVLILLIFGAVCGALLGCMRIRRNGIAHWLVFSAAYAVFTALAAFCYQTSRFPGPYNIRAWSILIVLAFMLMLPIVGLPWLVANDLTVRRETTGTSLLHRGRIVMIFTGAVFVAALAIAFRYIEFALRPAPTPSSYHIAPIDPRSAPHDLSEITRGSDWSCVNLLDGKPGSTGMDLHFAALDGEARWQGFDHDGNERPFFDLEHAHGIEQFFAGSYLSENAKLLLMSDEAGLSLQFESKGAMKIDADSLRVHHDPRLRGEILLMRNGYNGVFKTIAVRELSAQQMSIVEEFENNGVHSIESICRRIHDPTFRPVPRLVPDNGRQGSGEGH
jgi:hypothetical protein